MCRLSGGKMRFAYRDYGILRRGVPFAVILERSEGSRRGHLSLRMTVLICWLCLLFTYRGDVSAYRKSGRRRGLHKQKGHVLTIKSAQTLYLRFLCPLFLIIHFVRSCYTFTNKPIIQGFFAHFFLRVQLVFALTTLVCINPLFKVSLPTFFP